MELQVNLEAKSGKITTELGISEERTKELDNIIDEAWEGERGDNITLDFQFIANNVNTIEEYTYVLFNYSTRIGKIKAMRDNPLFAMMRGRA